MKIQIETSKKLDKYEPTTLIVFGFIAGWAFACILNEWLYY